MHSPSCQGSLGLIPTGREMFSFPTFPLLLVLHSHQSSEIVQTLEKCAVLRSRLDHQLAHGLSSFYTSVKGGDEANRAAEEEHKPPSFVVSESDDLDGGTSLCRRRG